MIRKVVCIAAIVAVAVATGVIYAQQDAVAEIKALSKKGHAAHIAGDRKGVDELLASDYARVYTDANKGTERQQLDKLGACGVASLNILEQDVRVTGDMAVENTLAELTLKDKAKGKTKVRYTAVWAKRDGRWQVVHFHH